MEIYKGELDITKTIKIIEQLKSQLLSNVSLLFSNMVKNSSSTNVENIDILADIVILSYLLSAKLGSSNEALDIKVINKLKLAILQGGENDDWSKEIMALSRHLNKSRGL